jgi:hypothetical protein
MNALSAVIALNMYLRECLPQLRRRLCTAPDPPGAGMAGRRQPRRATADLGEKTSTS